MAAPVGCLVPAAAQAAEEVRLLNQAYIIAARDNDARWFRQHMATDVLVILGSGLRYDKQAFLAMVEAAPKRLKALLLRDVGVRVYGPTVQVDADAPWELLDGAKGVSRYIDTYAWIDCRWQVVSAQVTLLPPPDEG